VNRPRARDSAPARPCPSRPRVGRRAVPRPAAKDRRRTAPRYTRSQSQVHEMSTAGTSGSCTGRMALPGEPVSGDRMKKDPGNRLSACERKTRRRAGSAPPMTDPSPSARRCPQAGTPIPGGAEEAGAGTAVRATVPPSGCRVRGWSLPGLGRADLTGRAESRVDACGPGREASPPCRPARALPSATARDLVPGPAGLPLRLGRAARQSRPRRTPRGLRSRLGWFPCPGWLPWAGDPRGGPGAGGGRT